jgi:hypothetical protein
MSKLFQRNAGLILTQEPADKATNDSMALLESFSPFFCFGKKA